MRPHWLRRYEWHAKTGTGSFPLPWNRFPGAKNPSTGKSVAPPADVTGLAAYPADGFTDLVWQAPADLESDLDHLLVEVARGGGAIVVVTNTLCKQLAGTLHGRVDVFLLAVLQGDLETTQGAPGGYVAAHDPGANDMDALDPRRGSGSGPC